MSTGQYYRVCRALLRSVQLSDTSSSGDEAVGGQLGGLSVSSSVERQTMRDQLDVVRQTLNSLSSQPQPNASGINAAPAGLDNALNEIGSKLTSIEGLYSSLTGKLEKIDLRVEDSERHIKELQHLSASTIHETARLVDFVGGKGTPAGRTPSHAGAGPPGSGSALRTRNLTSSGVPASPPQPGMSTPRSTVGTMDYIPAHVTATIQQHAAQIHKVIAGLDFLEAHIIRQDQLVENLQKQLLTVARDISSSTPAGLPENRSSPSEMSRRIHDMDDLLNKLRAHMYKVEKKTSSNDQALTLLMQRVQAVELLAPVGGRRQQQPVARESASEQFSHLGPESTSVQSSVEIAPSLQDLVVVQEELRGMLQDVSRDVVELRDQLQAQKVQPPQSPEPVTRPAEGMSAEECAEIQSQLSYLMSKVPGLLAENTELKGFAARATKQIDDLSSEVEQQRRRQQQQEQRQQELQPQQQQQLVPFQTAAIDSTAADGAVAALRATVAELQQQLSSFEGSLQNISTRTDTEPLSSALRAMESRMVTVEAVAKLDVRLSAVLVDVAGLQERCTALQDGLSERVKEAAASRLEITSLSGAVQALATEQSRAVKRSSTPSEDTPHRGLHITEGSPEASLRASRMSALAKAEFEEQVGQLRQRVEMAEAAAEAAAAAARKSTASVEVLAAARQAGKAGSTSQLENVMVMIASLEQEQSALKQQLAQLAAQVSEEQAAISSGLVQVQEQVAAAANAAMEAATCAHAVQEQQVTSSQQERESTEQLKAMQTELQGQVATVIEQLKDRVDQGMQQMGTHISAVNDRLSTAVTAQQLEVEVGKLQAAVAAGSAERFELATASLKELRGEFMLFTDQQYMLQSRLEGMESVLGLDPRHRQLGSIVISSAHPSMQVEDAEQRDNRHQATEAEPWPVQVPVEEEGNVVSATVTAEALQPGNVAEVAAAAAMPAAGVPGRRGGLLDLVADLQSRIGGLEGSLDAVGTGMDQLRVLMQSNADRTQDTIQQATAQLHQNLQDLGTAVDQRVASATADLLAMEAASAALQQKFADQEGLANELAAQMEGVQLRFDNEVIARIQETSATVSSLSTRIATDYVSREQLGAIFKARDNMKRAVDELASVFSTGRLMRTASPDGDSVNPPSEPEASSGATQRSGSGTLSPRLVSALEDLAGKQAELEHQVQMALNRTEGVVRQEQLASVQQAMLTLETQLRRLGASAQPQGPATPVPAEAVKLTAMDVADLRARVEAVEAALAAGVATTAALADNEEPLDSTEAFAVVNSALLQSGLIPGSTLRVTLTPEDHDYSTSTIRLRVLVVSSDVAGAPRLDVDGPEEPCAGSIHEAMEGAEPSLSSMLHGIRTGPNDDSASVESSPEVLSRAALASAAREAQSELLDLRRTLQELFQQSDALRMEVASEGLERRRLAEALGELQERLDQQVNATASTAAMVATMATDQPQERVRLNVQVGITEAEADLAGLASTVSMLATRLCAVEEALASAFIIKTPCSSKHGAPAALEAADFVAAEEKWGEATGAGHSDFATKDNKREAEEDNDAAASSHDGPLQPALGTTLPVLPREVERQLLELQTALAALVTRMDGLEAADALDEVRAAASEAVLDAIPGMVSQQVAAVREEMSALVRCQGEKLLEMAGQAARDAAGAVSAVRETMAQCAVAQAAAEEAAARARTASEVAAEYSDDRHAALIRNMAVAVAQEAAGQVSKAVAREVAEVTARAVVEEVKDVRGDVSCLMDRINDVDTLRDQLEALAVQVRESINSEAVEPAAVGAPSAQVQPATPTAVAVASIFTPASTALVIPPARSPHGISPSGASRPTATGSQQAAFLARMVEVVKRQSSRLHAQYNDAEETGAALAQVDHTLEEAEARLADLRDAASPAFAETLVTVLEQVAALRYIGSQTHPAVQQMVLEHENRLDQIAEELKALSGGSPQPGTICDTPTVASLHATFVEEIGVMSRQVARMEAELAKVASQHATLDHAVKEMLAAVCSACPTTGMPSAFGSLDAFDATCRASRKPSTAVICEVLEAAAGPPTEHDSIESARVADGTDPSSQPQPVLAFPLELAGLMAHIRLVEGTMGTQLSALREELMGEIRTQAGNGSGFTMATAAATAAELSELEKTVTKLHSAVTAIRNRLLAMQEYVDSTQGMIKDMHIALGGLVRRVDGLEAASGPSMSVSGCDSTSGGADGGSIRELQTNLHKFEQRLLELESSTLEAAHALVNLKGLPPRVTEVESRLLDACSKLAVLLGGSASITAPVIPAPGTTLPAMAGSVRSLERRLAGRMEAACSALDTLVSALSAAGRIQAESTNNPFKAISAAVNNPVVVAMEKKLEAVRTEVLAVATSLSEDMRRDQQHHQLESRLASAEHSISGVGIFRG